jgi:hypothetical protein
MPSASTTSARNPLQKWLVIAAILIGLAVSGCLSSSTFAAAVAHNAPELADIPSIQAASANTPHLRATPDVLRASGGYVRLHVNAHGKCTFFSSKHFKHLPAHTSCKSGIIITIGANASASARNYTFFARAGHRQLQTVIAQAPADTAADSAPVIITAPVAPLSVSLGQTVTLTAAASGTPTPTAQWQVLNDGTWTNIEAPTTASSTSLSFVVTAANNGANYRVSFTNAIGSALSPAVTIVVGAVPDTSQNWSGYASASGPFSSVSATWTVPTLTCSSTNTYSSQWVGIDGWGDSDVEQDGVSAFCLNGAAAYYPWYEMWGDNNLNGGLEVSLPNGDTVSAGNVITATTSAIGGGWVYTIVDATAKWSFTSPRHPLTVTGSDAEFGRVDC